MMVLPWLILVLIGGDETAEGNKSNLLLNTSFILCTIVLLSVSPRQSSHNWQRALDPPMRFVLVAASLCPRAFFLQSLEQWLHPPCVQQYESIKRRRKLALSGVLRVRPRLPSASPEPAE